MKAMFSGSVCVAGVLSLGMVAFAQGAGQQPAAPQAQAGSSADQQITVTGCVQREADYRRAQDAGKGGVAGTGIGAGNEFVLIDASTSGSAAAGASARAEGASPVGTSGAGAMAYELTGPNEGTLAQHVGRRVEISGKLKAAETSAAGQPSGGPTAGRPPSGVDVLSKDLKLRELEVASVREAAGSCPASK